ncbi:MAG: hypothetical protein HY675_12725 [Chloroflexi bacterium]|nr:hypothetical protein [Chloroflexota bacterium]
MAGGKLFVLQARPITNLPDQALEPIPVPAEPPPGFWERHVIHFPDPVSPMLRYSYLPVHIAGLKHAFEDLSLLAEGVDFQEIGGWIYSRLVPLGGKDRPTPPPWLMPLLIRLNRPIRNRVKGMVQAVRSDVIGSYIERWQVEWKPGQEKRIAELITVDLMGTSDEALGQHVDAVLTFLAESARIHGLVSWVDLVVPELAFACRDLLGWDDWRTLDLLSGLSEQTGAPSRSLSDLARMARERPAVRRLLEHIDRDTVSRLAEADPEFAAAFGAYQQEFGCQLTRFDIDGPTLAEQPELLLGLIRDQIARGYDPKADAAALAQTRAAALAEARDALATRSVTERERFERALARAERGYPIRDEHEFSVTSAPLVLLRYAVLEMGNRLAQRGLIAEREDIFFLEMSEAREALEGGGAHCRALVARRRAERAWALAHPGPASYGKPPGPPPSLAAFPPEARQLMEAMLWMIDRWFAPQLAGNGQPTGTTSITGIAASPGRYTGPVRVIQGEAEFGKLQTGDVLLCPTTSPAWCVLFPSVGALVTDTGGILSHPAIIAREYRIPAIVATGNAMAVLHDGQLVTVDGNSGRVEILR